MLFQIGDMEKKKTILKMNLILCSQQSNSTIEEDLILPKILDNLQAGQDMLREEENLEAEDILRTLMMNLLLLTLQLRSRTSEMISTKEDQDLVLKIK